jgi:hypothetical protein
MAKSRFNLRKLDKKITLPVQSVQIFNRFQEFRFRFERSRGVWKGSLQPNFTSPKYLVEVVYSLGKIPKVWVLSPKIIQGTGHLYGDDSLCLYWPKEWVWGPNEIIAKTILPWTANWLAFYELWLDTNKWLGPSSHEDPRLSD